MLTFLIPTAKEMRLPEETGTQHLSEKSAAIVHTMSQITPKELAKAYHIKEEAAKREAHRIETLEAGTAVTYPAIQLFNGLMYRHLKRDFSSDEQDYVRQSVYICSSLYGILPAFAAIAEHRHDFHTKMTVQGQSLRSYWRDDYDNFAADRETIVSLLSSEFEEVFSKKIRETFICLKFMEERDGQFKTHSTISKKARGAFLTAAIENHAESLEELKKLTFADFCYRHDLSGARQLIYTKKV